MAKKFKDYYDTDCARLLSDKIGSVWSRFDKNKFIQKIESELSGKEFLERQDLFVEAFELCMTKDYKRNIAIFHKILGPELKTTAGMFIDGWWLWPVGRYVEKHGTEDFQTSMDFIYELTKRFTGEFAIRPLIEKFPKRSVKLILQWSKDKNVHVRRLASESIRIRLPWAKKTLVALDEFSTYKEILWNLKNDPERFVQKSVGNNLNDLMKEAPHKANEIITSWQKDNPSDITLWIIKHGSRSKRIKKAEGG